MSTPVLKSKIAKLEAKLGEQKSGQENVNGALEMLEEIGKQMRMNMTPEELRQAKETEDRDILVWYSRYLSMNAEERKSESEKLEREAIKDNEDFKLWKASPEYAKFQREYSARFSSEAV